MMNGYDQKWTESDWKKFEAVRTHYDWCCEELADGGEDADIEELYHVDTYAEAVDRMGDFKFARVSLTRDRGSEAEGLQDRQFAYVEDDGTLPEEFDGGAKIPKRFHNEVTIKPEKT